MTETPSEIANHVRKTRQQKGKQYFSSFVLCSAYHHLDCNLSVNLSDREKGCNPTLLLSGEECQGGDRFTIMPGKSNIYNIHFPSNYYSKAFSSAVSVQRGKIQTGDICKKLLFYFHLQRAQSSYSILKT